MASALTFDILINCSTNTLLLLETVQKLLGWRWGLILIFHFVKKKKLPQRYHFHWLILFFL